jgi:hypothetical protein
MDGMKLLYYMKQCTMDNLRLKYNSVAKCRKPDGALNTVP